MTFFAGSATLCTVQLPANSCKTSPTLAAGAYPIVAIFPRATPAGVAYELTKTGTSSALVVR
jgi:hypothetical protein